jgi:hypothetical protein
MSKRTKINFEKINKGNYTVIPAKDIAEVNKRISENMTPVIRDFNRKEALSWIAVKDKIKV